MQLNLLKNIALLFRGFNQIKSIKRIDNNLFKMQLDEELFYLDVNKQNSAIFIAPNILSQKTYQAPFDILLQKLCTRAKIKDCYTDGNNRILVLSCNQKNTYKNFDFLLYFEFTGKYTNVILTDTQQIILEALHHLNKNKSFREIKIGQALIPLAQQQINYQEVPYNKQLLLQILKDSYLKKIHYQINKKKQVLLQRLEKKSMKLKNLLSSLPPEEELISLSKKLSEQATLLLANLHLIKPYAKQISLKNFEQKIITIQMQDNNASPQEMINAIFIRSKKTLQKAKGIAIQKQNLKDKISFLAQQIKFIIDTNSLENILIFENSKKIQKKIQKFESFFIENIKISIGRNQTENQQLLENARANDIWLHIKNIPSSHMIIHCGKTKIPLHVLQKAGEILVGLNSITNGKFEVDYTLRKFVKIKERARVVYSKHKTLNYLK